MTWYKSSPVSDKLLKEKLVTSKVEVNPHTLAMLTKDLNKLVKHMDSIRTLNHTFQKPISINTDTNLANDWQVR